MAEGINAILEERGKRYGSFTGHAEITQQLKGVMLDGNGLSLPTMVRVQSRAAMLKPDQR